MQRKPIMLFDGDCGFCKFWINVWKNESQNRITYKPYQKELKNFPDIKEEELAKAIHFIGEEGHVFKGAEAVFKSIALMPRWSWFAVFYNSFLASFFEKAYTFVAHNRQIFSKITFFLYGRSLTPSSYQFSRWFFYKGLALVFFLAFLSLYVQMTGLFFENGIMPIRTLMDNIRIQLPDLHFFKFPTLFWISSTDFFIKGLCMTGLVASLSAFLGFLPGLSILIAWISYLSFTIAGQPFMSFQWDVLLCEVGFLAIFFLPLLSGKAIYREPSRLFHWLLRYLLVRLYLASGLVKLYSGDQVWKSLDALSFHYFTQPLPHGLSWYFHQLPAWFDQLSVFVMFVIEILVPFLILCPRRMRFFAFFPLMLLQILIFLSGNYNFFNLLTVLLIFLILDDHYLRKVVPNRLYEFFERFRPGVKPSHIKEKPLLNYLFLFVFSVIFIKGFSMEAQRFLNMKPPGIIQDFFHATINPFRLVNSYGLFASMTTERREIDIQGSMDGVTWYSYQFKYKPHNVSERPRWVQPHQPRLDWQMWFAALSTYDRQPWFFNFLTLLIQNEPTVHALMAKNPFPSFAPTYLRCRIYSYEFTNWEERRATGQFWKKGQESAYTPIFKIEKKK